MAASALPLLLLPLFALAPVAQAIPSVLVYSRTAGYRHDSIPTAIDALRNQSSPSGGSYPVSFTFSEDPSLFTTSGLKGFDALLFLSNSDQILGLNEQEAFQAYLTQGGGFVGVHSASAALFDDPTYGREVGAFFDYHPSLQNVTFEVINSTTHPSTAMLPARWTVEEECYFFRSDPRANGATLLLTVDEDSFTNDGNSTGYYGQGDPHPIAWYQERGNGSDTPATAGRSFYTSLGHLNSTWRDELFLAHLMEGLQWTLDGNTTLAFVANGSVGNATGRIDPTTSSSVPPSTATDPSTSAPASPSSGTSAGSPVRFVSRGSVGGALLAGAVLALGAYL